MKTMKLLTKRRNFKSILVIVVSMKCFESYKVSFLPCVSNMQIVQTYSSLSRSSV